MTSNKPSPTLVDERALVKSLHDAAATLRFALMSCEGLQVTIRATRARRAADAIESAILTMTAPVDALVTQETSNA